MEDKDFLVEVLEHISFAEGMMLSTSGDEDSWAYTTLVEHATDIRYEIKKKLGVYDGRSNQPTDR